MKTMHHNRAMTSMQSGLVCKQESTPSVPLDGYPAVDYNLTLKPLITTLWKFANNPGCLTLLSTIGSERTLV
jgi:hypothetical protein